MTSIWSYFLLVLSVVYAEDFQQQIQGFGQQLQGLQEKSQSGIEKGFSDFSRGIQKEIQAAKQPIDETIVYIGSSQCANVKRIFGVEYDQIYNKSEPDLGKLALKVFTPYYNTTYALGEAATYITRDPLYHQSGKLVIFVHGFTDDPSKGSFNNISQAFKWSELGNNVMALDGSSLISSLYIRATTYVRFMGDKLGDTLAVLVNAGVAPENIHIIGHSLGAHIAGFTGKRFMEKTGLKVGRITGLDPAGPCFSTVAPELRLSSEFASYVDVVHTDAGVYGIKDALGHADYFPNSGSEQPNCLFQTCSHSRAWILYAISIIKNYAFPAVKCEDWNAFKKGQCDYNDISYMGYASNSSSRGRYYLQTGEDPLYGLYEAGLKYKDNEAVISKVGSFLTG